MIEIVTSIVGSVDNPDALLDGGYTLSRTMTASYPSFVNFQRSSRYTVVENASHQVGTILTTSLYPRKKNPDLVVYNGHRGPLHLHCNL